MKVIITKILITKKLITKTKPKKTIYKITKPQPIPNIGNSCCISSVIQSLRVLTSIIEINFKFDDKNGGKINNFAKLNNRKMIFEELKKINF